MLLEPLATPVVELKEPLFKQAGVRVLLKRLDLVHPVISGNKWYKLKYNLLAARELGADTLLSFGGAFSNHIHALAGAGSCYGFNTIGVIRGEPHSPLNPTLQFAQSHGMQLHYLTRADYRLKHTPEIVERLRDQFGAFYLVPEGGSNALAVKGTAEILADVTEPFDVVLCACGTGGTLAGIVSSLQPESTALGVAVLKGGRFLYDDVRRLLADAQAASSNNWSLALEYHFGGYAKAPDELLVFMQAFEQRHNIPLEPVYTAKLMFAIYKMVERGEFERGTTLLALHTGGLQGRAGYGLGAEPSSV